VATKDVLNATSDFYFLRGQAWVVSFVTLLMTVAYWFGTMNVLEPYGNVSSFEALLIVPASGVMFRPLVLGKKGYFLHSNFMLQVLVLLVLLLWLLF
jgi:hypothetical protein